MRIFIFLFCVTIGATSPLNTPRCRAGETVQHSVQKAEQQYTCPMHPQVKSDHPGECPICHMKLVPVKPQPSKGLSEEGRSSFDVTPDQLKLSGTRIVPIVRKNLIKLLRVPGRALGGGGISFQVYEQDLALIQSGMMFQAEAPMLSGERLRGKITSIDSILDPMTRTARVNGVLLEKPSLPLRAESSLSGSIEIRLPNVLAVPETAVLHTGSTDLLFISNDANGANQGGQFSPRAIQLGSKAQGYYEVKGGVRDGERISEGPNFLLDSESRIEFGYGSP